MGATAAVLERVQSSLEMREDELITMHDAQTKVATEIEQLLTRTGNRSPESFKMHSAAEDDQRPAKRAKVGRGPSKE